MWLASPEHTQEHRFFLSSIADAWSNWCFCDESLDSCNLCAEARKSKKTEFGLASAGQDEIG
jgi:hypothetical protein